MKRAVAGAVVLLALPAIAVVWSGCQGFVVTHGYTEVYGDYGYVGPWDDGPVEVVGWSIEPPPYRRPDWDHRDDDDRRRQEEVRQRDEDNRRRDEDNRRRDEDNRRRDDEDRRRQDDSRRQAETGPDRNRAPEHPGQGQHPPPEVRAPAGPQPLPVQRPAPVGGRGHRHRQPCPGQHAPAQAGQDLQALLVDVGQTELGDR